MVSLQYPLIEVLEVSYFIYGFSKSSDRFVVNP